MSGLQRLERNAFSPSRDGDFTGVRQELNEKALASHEVQARYALATSGLNLAIDAHLTWHHR